MDRAELSELHCITPIQNLGSILHHGVLSYERAARLPHASVALRSCQTRRDEKTVPDGLKLHQYANLYINARNAMLYSRRSEDICVLQVSPKVLDFAGVVITDRNAASWCEWLPSPGGLEKIDRDIVFAQSWNHDDERLKREHRLRMCAEVLVPHSLHPSYIVGAYVRMQSDKARIQAIAPQLPVSINGYMFFV